MQFSFLTVVNIDKEGKKKRHGEIFVTDLLVDHLQTSADWNQNKFSEMYPAWLAAELVENCYDLLLQWFMTYNITEPTGNFRMLNRKFRSQHGQNTFNTPGKTFLTVIARKIQWHGDSWLIRDGVALDQNQLERSSSTHKYNAYQNSATKQSVKFAFSNECGGVTTIQD